MKKMVFIIFSFITSVVTSAQSTKFEWAKQIGGALSTAEGFAIASDASGNTYTTGDFSGTVDFDPGVGVFNLTTTNNIFILKLNALGNLVWAKNLNGTLSGGHAQAITVDAAENSYITGCFEGTIDFDPGIGTANLTAIGGIDMFILKLDATGAFLWAQRIGGTYHELGNSIATDVLGNIYITGIFQGTVDFDPSIGITNLISAGGDYDAFILKLNASGNFVWAKQVGGTSSDWASCMALDVVGNIYIAGSIAGTGDFDPGIEIFNLTSVEKTEDIFILKLDPLGNFVWAKTMGGPSTDIAYAIVVDAQSNVYTTGKFTAKADFDPNVGIYNLTAPGYGDIFISKLNESGSFVWAKHMGGFLENRGYAIKLDAASNVYTTGSFKETIDFDPGPARFNLTAPGNTGTSNIFILKLNSSGIFLWAKNMGGDSQDEGRSICVDAPLGNIYTTGSFRTTADFDPDLGVFDLASIGDQDLFIHKMSQNISGIYENITINSNSAYPNPTSDLINIIVPISVNDATIEIVNSVGTLVYKRTNIRATNTITLANQSNGLYFVKVINENNQVIKTEKIIKQ